MLIINAFKIFVIIAIKKHIDNVEIPEAKETN